MKLLEKRIKYAKSKFGRISFKYTDNVKDDHTSSLNEEWTSDLVEAFLNEDKIGYCYVRYLTPENFKKYIENDILYYVSQYTGKIPGYTYNKGNIPELVKQMSMAIDPWTEWIPNKIYNGELPSDLPVSWWETKYKKYKEKLKIKFWKEIKDLKTHFVNKPLIDFIRVNDFYHGGGVGYGLYIAMALFMKEKGLALWASDLQSEQAAKAWKRMERLGLPVKTSKEKWDGNTISRRRLDYR